MPHSEETTRGRPAEEAMERQFVAMREALRTVDRLLSGSDDAVAKAIFAELARCRSIEVVIEVLERLQDRIEATGAQAVGRRRQARARTLVRL